MKKIFEKIRKIVLLIVLFSYFVLIISVSILLLSKNEYGVSQFDDKVLILINNEIANNDYKNGDLVIVKNVEFKDLKTQDEIFIYKPDEKKGTVQIIVSNISQIEFGDTNNVTIAKDNTVWSDDYIIGKYSKKYENLGKVLSFLESKWIFFSLLILPAFFILLYEIYRIILVVKYDDGLDDDNNYKDVIENNETITLLKDSPYDKFQKKEPVVQSVLKTDRKDLNSGTITIVNNNISLESFSGLTEEVIINKFGKINIVTENFNDDNIDVDKTNLRHESIIKNITIDEEKTEQNQEVIDESKNSEEKTKNNEFLIQEDDELDKIGNKIYETIDKMNDNNSKIEIGKNEKNLIKKGMMLITNEITELIYIILNPSNRDDYKSIITKASSYYADKRYLKNLNSKDLKTELLLYFNNQLIDHDNRSYQKRLREVAIAFTTICDFEYDYSNVEEVINKSAIYGLDIEKKQQMIEKLKGVIDNYQQTLDEYFKKIYSGKFELITKKVAKSDFYMTNLSAHIRFSKIFSDDFINKSYDDEIVKENLKEVQLKLITSKLFHEIVNDRIRKKYLIYFYDSLYKKQKKLKSILSSIEDDYSQKLVSILVDYQIFKDNYNVIVLFKQLGFDFCINLTYEQLQSLDNKEKLCVFSKIFVESEQQEDIEKYIPLDYFDNVVFVKKTLIEKVVIK